MSQDNDAREDTVSGTETAASNDTPATEEAGTVDPAGSPGSAPEAVPEAAQAPDAGDTGPAAASGDDDAGDGGGSDELGDPDDSGDSGDSGDPGELGDEDQPAGWMKGAAAAAKAAFAGKGSDEDEPLDPLEALTQEVADLKDRLLRTAAEAENVRKRAAREKVDTTKYAIAGFARDMLGVGDTLQRALANVPAEEIESNPAIKSFCDGIELTSIELRKAMQQHGVVQEDPDGEKFDPNKHQGVANIPHDTVPKGMIVEVFQPGYMIADRVLRPAMVAISTGPTKAAPPGAEPPATDAEADTTDASPADTGDAPAAGDKADNDNLA